MGTPENMEAVAIVFTNVLRSAINLKKAQSISKLKSSPKLTICAAYDTLSSEVVPVEYHKQLLQTDFMALSKFGALPSFIPLYIGMPVILKARNLSTDLKITNGSKGIVRHVSVKQSSFDLTSAKAALIKFSDSPIKCSHLPPGYFLIEPISWTFVTTLNNPDGTKTKNKITRHQLPLEPAFSLTSYGCQGQTINKVLADLQIEGFSTYVQAS